MPKSRKKYRNGMTPATKRSLDHCVCHMRMMPKYMNTYSDRNFIDPNKLRSHPAKMKRRHAAVMTACAPFGEAGGSEMSDLWRIVEPYAWIFCRMRCTISP